MTRPTVLLLPGLLCDEAVWADQRVALSPVAQCIVPTYKSLASIEEMARHVLALAPLDRFSLAGHSMGGRVALEVMRLAPERIERFALLDSGVAPLAAGAPGERERTQRLALLRVAREQGMRAMGRQWARGMVHSSRLETPLFEKIIEMIARNTPDDFEAQILALLARPDSGPVLAAVRCPTLLACGRQDAWSPLARHEDMQRLVPSSRLLAIEDSGHMTTMEQPTAVSRALLDWLAA